MAWPRLPRLRALNLPWRRPAIETTPIRLGARRLYILPTRQGLVFALLLVGLLVGSANYGISLGYMFTFLLGGLAMVTMFHTQRNLAGLILRTGQPTAVHVGDQARCPVILDNPDPSPRWAVHVSGLDGDAATDIAAQSEALVDLPWQPAERGVQRLGPVTLSSTWPLGLFRCWTVVHPDWSLLAYPIPAPSHWPLPKAADAGRELSGERPGDDTFAGLRGYHTGDSPRHIAWKAVARGLALQTKQFVGQSGGHVRLDWDAAPERDVEARLSRLTRWALEAERTGLEWGMSLPELSIPPGHGSAHLKRCLEALARHEA